MSISADDQLRADGRLEWSRDIILNGEPSIALARSFVCQQLVQHRLYHLVDVARVVAGEFAAYGALYADPPLTLTVSKMPPWVLLRVDIGSDEGRVTARPLDAWDSTRRSRVVDRLSVDWGARCERDTVVGLWATFDARRHRHAIDKVGRAMGLTRGPRPVVRGAGGSG